MDVLGDVMVEGIDVQIPRRQGDGEGSVHGEDGLARELDPEASGKSSFAVAVVVDGCHWNWRSRKGATRSGTRPVRNQSSQREWTPRAQVQIQRALDWASEEPPHAHQISITHTRRCLSFSLSLYLSLPLSFSLLSCVFVLQSTQWVRRRKRRVLLLVLGLFASALHGLAFFHSAPPNLWIHPINYEMTKKLFG